MKIKPREMRVGDTIKEFKYNNSSRVGGMKESSSSETISNSTTKLREALETNVHEKS